MIHGVEVVQVPMPRNQEERARGFYGLILGLRELTRSTNLSRTGAGMSFALPDGRELVLEVQDRFRPMRQAGLALVVPDLEGLSDTLGNAGHRTEWDFNGQPLKFFCLDPFGNQMQFANTES